MNSDASSTVSGRRWVASITTAMIGAMLPIVGPATSYAARRPLPQRRGLCASDPDPDRRHPHRRPPGPDGNAHRLPAVVGTGVGHRGDSVGDRGGRQGPRLPVGVSDRPDTGLAHLGAQLQARAGGAQPGHLGDRRQQRDRGQRIDGHCLRRRRPGRVFRPASATTSGAGHYSPVAPARLADTRCGDTPPRLGDCSAEHLPAANSAKTTVAGQLVAHHGPDGSVRWAYDRAGRMVERAPVSGLLGPAADPVGKYLSTYTVGLTLNASAGAGPFATLTGGGRHRQRTGHVLRGCRWRRGLTERRDLEGDVGLQRHPAVRSQRVVRVRRGQRHDRARCRAHGRRGGVHRNQQQGPGHLGEQHHGRRGYRPALPRRDLRRGSYTWTWTP